MSNCDQWRAAHANAMAQIERLTAEVAQKTETITRLCDRLERINQICWDSHKTGPAKLSDVKEWSAGFAEIPQQAQRGPNGECPICGGIECKPGCLDGTEIL